MLYTMLTALFFCSILIAMWFHFRRVAEVERKMYVRKLRVADNKIKLLELVSADLGSVTDKLSKSVGGAKPAAQNAAAKTKAGAAKTPTPPAAKGAAGKPAGPPAGDVDTSVTRAVRVFEDMSTLLAIWNNNFERANSEFDLFTLIRENIKAFADHLRKNKKDVRIVFDEQGAWRCVCDPNHVSRCLRAILAQATKQTEKGEIRVRAVVTEPVLTRRSKVVIVVTDNSERPQDDAKSYEIVPDRVHKNPFLRNDPSATVRLNVAQQTAIKLGGRLSFHTHASGNMSFKLSFTAEPSGVAQQTIES